MTDWAKLTKNGANWLLDGFPDRVRASLIPDFFRPVDSHLTGTADDLRLFVDPQLLISAQTTSDRVNGLHSAFALDLPRRGVVHVQGGVGAIAETLVDAIRANDGQVSYRKTVTRIMIKENRPVGGEAENFPLHHQLILGEPLGEGNSLFLSISPGWDDSRAP